MNENLADELRVACELARRAGETAMNFYGKESLHIERKGEFAEPVTEADFAANEIIVEGLRAAFPEDGLLSEELTDDITRLACPRLWVVDPLDGTKGFIAGDGDFAVQIGLAIEHESALGVVYLPAKNVLYWAVRERGAWIENGNAQAQQLRVSSKMDLHETRLAVSRSHRSPRMSRVVKTLGVREEVARGSVGVKVGLLVERRCDIYVHLSPHTKHWDTCAPEIILSEAGGRMTDLWGASFRYNLRDVQNHNGVVATNNALHDELIRRLAPLLDEFGREKI
ncbi:MAG: 3'(2'),5'-bisphosphate nucleotidase CysQ [Pyrinomonadaceae bacterium]